MHSSLLWGVFGPAATLVSHQFTTELESGAQIWRFWFVFFPAKLLRPSIAPPVVSSHTLMTQDRWWSWLICALRWRAIDRFCRLLSLHRPISCVIRVSACNGHNLGGDASPGDPLRVASQPAGPAVAASTHGIAKHGDSSVLAPRTDAAQALALHLGFWIAWWPSPAARTVRFTAQPTGL